MRKVKPKMTKREREEQRIKKVTNPLLDVGKRLLVFKSFLEDHRELWKRPDVALHFSMLGRLTITIKNIDTFLGYNFYGHYDVPKAFVDDSKRVVEDFIDTCIENDIEAKENFFDNENEINKKLFKSYLCALMVLGDILDIVSMQMKDDYTYGSFKDALRTTLYLFTQYIKFWKREIYDKISFRFF